MHSRMDVRQVRGGLVRALFHKASAQEDTPRKDKSEEDAPAKDEELSLEELLKLVESMRNKQGGGGLQGLCGGTRRFDGSGGGRGNVGTPRQPEA